MRFDYTIIVAALALLIEIATIGWRRSVGYALIFECDNSRLTDLFFFLIQVTGLVAWVSIIPSLGLVVATFRFIPFVRSHVHNFSTECALADAVIYILVFTFFDDWGHRLGHCGPFWYLHRMHHSAEHLSPMVSSRNNPIGKFMEPFLGSWPLALCAVAPSYLFAINIGNLLYQFVVHIDTKCSWGWFGRWILVSPGAHRIHHSPMPEHFKKNLSILPLWDRLFGTWYDCAIINERVGLGEPIHNRAGMVKDCIADALEFGQGWAMLAFPVAKDLAKWPIP
jgi:sterol desaturase/sphingolipid hydroxylase (fatty acid hydroxylase superfamily)